uniref:Uncharacterized protein n=1 Tax=Myoviridae sp. ctsmU9 TaxID=2826706 RepID=A0A8S5MM70_9CAUD|nr:MAG TPA: hypothetical protein [Myoviridae sp. ctsmU9]
MRIEFAPLAGLQAFGGYPKVGAYECLSFPLFSVIRLYTIFIR